MKTLYIIRHAKSSWSFDLPDHDRPLGIRGRSDVKKMAKELSQKEPVPELFLSSTASRALYTALFVADAWGFPEEEILLDEHLYHAESFTITRILARLPDVDSVALFGHNPGLTDLINFLCEDELENLPTCGVAKITLDFHYWRDIKKASGKRELLLTPRKL